MTTSYVRYPASEAGIPTYPLLASDGSALAPSYSFLTEPNTGIYHGTGAIGFSVLGSEVFQLNAGSVQGLQPFQAADGTAAAPSFSLTNAATSGLYKFGTNSLGFATAGVTAGNISSAQKWTFAGQTLAPDGTAAVPSISLTNAATSGLYKFGANSIGFATNGLTAGNIDSSQNWTLVGSITLPNAGILWASEATLSLTRDGTGSLTLAETNAATSRLVILNSSTNGDANLSCQSKGTGDSYLTLDEAAAGSHWNLGRDDSASSNFIVEYASSTFGTGTLVLQSTTAGVVTIPVQLIGHGTSAADDAAAGYIGEYMTAESSGINAPTSTQYGDVASIVLTAGDWDISVNGEGLLGSGVAIVAMGMGIGTASGNSSTGQVAGINFHIVAPATSNYNAMVSVGNYRVSISGTTTYYLKMYAQYTSGTPQFRGRISARRIR